MSFLSRSDDWALIITYVEKNGKTKDTCVYMQTKKKLGHNDNLIPIDVEQLHLRHLDEATDVVEMANWIRPSIERLKYALSGGQHHSPEAARATKRSLDCLLDTLETVCDRRQVSFPEVLAYLSPAEDLLVALAAAASGNDGDEQPEI